MKPFTFLVEIDKLTRFDLWVKHSAKRPDRPGRLTIHAGIAYLTIWF